MLSTWLVLLSHVLQWCHLIITWKFKGCTLKLWYCNVCTNLQFQCLEYSKFLGRSAEQHIYTYVSLSMFHTFSADLSCHVIFQNQSLQNNSWCEIEVFYVIRVTITFGLWKKNNSVENFFHSFWRIFHKIWSMVWRSDWSLDTHRHWHLYVYRGSHRQWQF